MDNPKWLQDGFTITMWVKFLDRTTKGTLFTYGNPLRGYDPKGFRLETFVVGKDERLSSAATRVDGYETWSDVFPDDASIAPGDVFVVAHSSADAVIAAVTDVTFNSLSNGDDGFALVMGTEDNHVYV